MRFKILFEFCSFFVGAERYGCFDFPWTVFCCVGNLSIVVGFKSGFQIIRKAGIVASFVSLTDQNVNIIKIIQALDPLLACRGSLRSSFRTDGHWLAKAKFETELIST